MTLKRTLSIVLAIAFVFSCTSMAVFATEAVENNAVLSDTTENVEVTETPMEEGTVASDEVEVEDDEYAGYGNKASAKYLSYKAGQFTSYLTFINHFSDTEIIGKAVTLDINNCIADSKGAETKSVADDDNVAKDAVVIKENGYVDLRINVEREGLYHIGLEYLPIKENPIDIEFSFKIDGDTQYREVTSLMLKRTWIEDKTPDEDGNWPQRDINGNEVSPDVIEALKWTNYTLHDNIFSSDDDMLFYLAPGEHSIKINVLRESVALASITLGGNEQLPSYNSVYAEYQKKGYKPVSKDTNITLHAEYSSLKSDNSLVMSAEYTASTTNGTGDQLHYAKTRFNVLGGEAWKFPNDWIEYEIDVAHSGLYNLSFKYKQDYVEGMNVYRKVYIDGEIPFEEFSRVTFKPSSVWKNYTVSDKSGNPYYVYLEKGKHTIRLNATFGPIAETLQMLDAQTTSLNKWYMKIVQITGPMPDTLRDYDLHKTITGLIDGFEDIRDNLQRCYDTLIEINGGEGGSISFVEVLIKQLDDFIEEPETIASGLVSYKSNISELATNVTRMRNQSLLLDTIYLGAKESVPSPKLGFTEAITFAVKAFISSFSDEYSSFGSYEVEEGSGYDSEPILIWMGGGREQYNIVTSLVADKFVARYNIPVELLLGDTGSLTKAILAGIAPDIILDMGSDGPVNYAMRGALVDLTQFNDENSTKYDTTFDEAYQWFHKSAFIALEYQDGGVYGLPTSQGFSVMFVRADILDDYGLEAPDTWDEMFDLLGILQRNNMQVGLGSGDQGMLGTLVFQNGGDWYVEDKSKTAFDTEVFIDSFIKWTEFNTKWGIPLSYDAFNRFRTGEMPIVFSGYGLVNTFEISAPELQGLWEMKLLPGTRRVDENGNEYIDRTQQTGGSCIIMVDVGENAEYAWQFMTWWASADTQAEFNIKNETVLVAGARGAPANLEAFERLPWTYEQSQVIKAQWEWLHDQPRVPGDYYIGRMITNAYRAVIYEGRNPREALLTYNQDINIEIQRKRVEYNVDRFWEEGYVRTDKNGNKLSSKIDNEVYERPTSYFNLQEAQEVE